MITNILLGLLLIGIIFLILKKKEKGEDKNILEENARLKADLSQKDQSIGVLTKELQSEKTEKDQFAGKNKQMFVENTNLKAEKATILNEKQQLITEISKFKATESSKLKEFDNKIQKLDEAKIALEDEKKRIRKEDEEKIQREMEERNRMWAEHEGNVKLQLTELCKAPRYGFTYYDNNNLPVGFGGKFKPDFLIEFLDQYVIFDAKKSESDLQSYITNNVKSTVEKINNNSKIYNTVFFIVPTQAMESLKMKHYYEQGYEFFVIPPEAMEVVLASLKKINTYEIAQQLDPRDRENIVNLIAEFDHHINMRNTLDILASESGISVLKKAETLQKDIKEEILQKKIKIRPQNFTPTEIKTLMVGTETQSERISLLISPKVSIPEENIKKVKQALDKGNQ
ncbi:MAG: hypothetical protein Q8935_00190 [Bacillota bacterium]|nr:hypothetical protein [Bacillota bacterium]